VCITSLTDVCYISHPRAAKGNVSKTAERVSEALSGIDFYAAYESSNVSSKVSHTPHAGSVRDLIIHSMAGIEVGGSSIGCLTKPIVDTSIAGDEDNFLRGFNEV